MKDHERVEVHVVEFYLCRYTDPVCGRLEESRVSRERRRHAPFISKLLLSSKGFH